MDKVILNWGITLLFLTFTGSFFLYYIIKIWRIKITFKETINSEYTSFLTTFGIPDNTNINGFKKDPIYNKYIITYDFQDYLEENGVLEFNYKWVSGLLTGLGILGTFVGITFGLLNSPSMTNIKENQEFISTLLSGMTTAFLTSVAGIFTSLIFLFIHEYIYGKLHIILVNKYKEFHKDWIIETPEIYLRTQSEGYETLKESMGSLSQIVSKINNLLNPEELGKTIASSLTSVIQKELKPSFISISESSADLKKTNSELSKYIINDLPQIFEKLEKALNTANHGIQETNKAIISTNQSLEITRENLDKQNKEFQSIESMLKNYIVDLEKVLTEQRSLFKYSVEEIQKTTIITMNEAKVSMESAMNLSNANMKSSLEMMNSFITNNMNQLSDKINQLSISSIALLDKTKDDVSLVINDSNTKLQSTLNGVSEELVKTSDKVQLELEKFREEYATALKGFIEKQVELLDKSLGEHTGKLKLVVDGLGKELDTDLKKRKAFNDELEKQLIHLKEISEIQKSVEISVKDQLYDLIGQSNEVYTNATKSNQEFLGRIEEYRERNIDELNKYLEDQTTHLNRILTYMTSLVEVIGTANINNSN